MTPLRAFLLGLVVVAAPTASAAPAAAPVGQRVFVAPLKAGEGVSRDLLQVLEDRILVAAKRHADFTVLGGADVRAMIDLEAQKMSTGCETDADSCALEIAGALDARQIITGNLHHLGDSWLLSLSRTDRADLVVLGRVERESRGDSPRGLLDQVPGAVDELFGDAGPSFVVVGSSVAAAVSIAALATGAVATGLSWSWFDETQKTLNDPGVAQEKKVELRAKAIADGELANQVAVVAWISGGAAGALAAAGFVVAAIGAE